MLTVLLTTVLRTTVLLTTVLLTTVLLTTVLLTTVLLTTVLRTTVLLTTVLRTTVLLTTVLRTTMMLTTMMYLERSRYNGAIFGAIALSSEPESRIAPLRRDFWRDCTDCRIPTRIAAPRTLPPSLRPLRDCPEKHETREM